MKIKAKRTVIIGDVHGCYDELVELLDCRKLNFDPFNDHLVFVGDLINKGPKSREVLELIESIPCTVLKGNHELGFLKYLEERDGHYIDFENLIEELGVDIERFHHLLGSWPLYYEEADFLVVHAGVVEGIHPKEQDPRITTMIRTWDGRGENLKDPNNPPWYELYKEEKLIIFGHWAAQGLIERKKTIGLDSGCVYGGSLSALTLPERSIYQIKAKKCYKDLN